MEVIGTGWNPALASVHRNTPSEGFTSFSDLFFLATGVPFGSPARPEVARRKEYLPGTLSKVLVELPGSAIRRPGRELESNESNEYVAYGPRIGYPIRTRTA